MLKIKKGIFEILQKADTLEENYVTTKVIELFG